MICPSADCCSAFNKDRKHMRCWRAPVYSLAFVCILISVHASNVRTTLELTVPDHDASNLWKYVSLQLVHTNAAHLAFNIIAWCLYAIPLEMLHGMLRVCAINVVGGISGALAQAQEMDGDSSTTRFLGSSPGVYAIIGGMAANCVLNARVLLYAHLIVLSIVCILLIDVGLALFYAGYTEDVAVVSHFVGFGTGLMLGLALLLQLSHPRPRLAVAGGCGALATWYVLLALRVRAWS